MIDRIKNESIISTPVKEILCEIYENQLLELDLDENVIGHVCGGIILNALQIRKESKFICNVIYTSIF